MHERGRDLIARAVGDMGLRGRGSFGGEEVSEWGVLPVGFPPPSPSPPPRPSLTPCGRCTPRCAVRRDASRCRPPVRVTRYARATNTNCLSQINISRGKKTRLGTYNCRTSAITVSSLCLCSVPWPPPRLASPRRGGDTGAVPSPPSPPSPPPRGPSLRLG